MTEPVKHATFTIERTYPVPPEKVFAAFSDPKIKQQWFVEGPGWTTASYSLDFRVGGREHASGGAPDGKSTYANDTLYQDIVPSRRIIFAYTMDANGKRISASLGTVALESLGAGTKFTFTEQAAFFESSDGPEIRKFGWTELFERLNGALTGAAASPS